MTEPRTRESQPARKLVVEDDIHIRQLSTRMLLRSGYQVDAAEDGEAGWEALQARHYDLLIIDNNRPNLGGVELVKMLHSACMTLPVIMASGAIPTEELNRHPGLQLAATLLKPFTLDELLGTVKKVLRARDSSRERIEPLLI